ncbi:MAG: nitrilase-related carbon-nitrogen hydrolase [Methanothrix sp.]
MRAACLQLSVEPCHPDKNLSRALQMAGAALAEGAEILVFPELFLTGFCYEPSLQSSSSAQDQPPYPSLDPFRTLAREHKCLIIGSIRSGRQNLGFCLGGDGLELRPKIHPFAEEEEHFDGGDFISPVATKWGLVGLEICYDLRFPEVARTLALQGADFLVTVAQFPASRREQWRVLAMARAIENQMPHLACNWANGGGSLIIDARGRVLAEAGSEQALLWADIDLADQDLFRREVSCFADRRPEIYGRWDAERSNP